MAEKRRIVNIEKVIDAAATRKVNAETAKIRADIARMNKRAKTLKADLLCTARKHIKQALRRFFRDCKVNDGMSIAIATKGHHPGYADIVVDATDTPYCRAVQAEKDLIAASDKIACRIKQEAQILKEKYAVLGKRTMQKELEAFCS